MSTLCLQIQLDSDADYGSHFVDNRFMFRYHFLCDWNEERILLLSYHYINALIQNLYDGGHRSLPEELRHSGE